MRASVALTLAALLAVATLFAWQLAEPARRPASQPEAATEPAVAEARPVAERATGPTRHDRRGDEAGHDDDLRDQLLLPDGTYVPTLNGAVDAAPIAEYWGPSEWSPIIGTRTSSAGLEWYEHADGSFSTTQMVMRQDLGRMAAMTRVAHPRAEATPASGPAAGR